jgi:hypothetical protein
MRAIVDRTDLKKAREKCAAESLTLAASSSTCASVAADPI